MAMMPPVEGSITYPLSSQWWSGEGTLTVRDTRGQTLLELPLQFIRLGRVPSFDFVKEQCRNAFEGEGTLVRMDGSRIDDSELVSAGDVVLAGEGPEPHRPRRGPRFKYKYRAPVEGDTESSMSNSKRSSANQNKFREALLVRDGSCLLSDTLYERCTAAHILPQSRPEYYTEVLEHEVRYLFMPSYGLLLRDDLHHSFDRGEIALYPKGSDLIVHVFAPGDDALRGFHGKILKPERFRPPEDRRPDVRLLRFHYQQCAIKYFRGFAWAAGKPTEFKNGDAEHYIAVLGRSHDCMGTPFVAGFGRMPPAVNDIDGELLHGVP
ncbi:hypothetical protein BDZ90DRAFT_263363 [Jaminaea rosea]|uniref:HNH nuclease domain-containing protein n=1 Tax=Jaminaea rosea TaxID=1569628 RepID=A0A316UHG7_9BASI|nr:hypothetical protein BDZ90DRAFT_263363 [Jaminaea rosea]PWN24348.1 hypothetical protein BDZ90DRAFT_263363 [Jaminaea rosea]